MKWLLTSMEDKQVIVYVRRGTSDENRLLAFNRKNLPMTILLAHGFAFDGNQVRKLVAADPVELLAAELEIIELLGKFGIEVTDFR